MTKLLKAIFLLFALCVFGSSVYALSCGSGSRKLTSLPQDGNSFIGTAIDIQENVGSRDLFSFEVEQVLKGGFDGNQIVLKEAINFHGIGCSDVVIGKKYIVNTSDGVSIDYGGCSCNYASIDEYSLIELGLLKHDLLVKRVSWLVLGTTKGILFWTGVFLVGMYLLLLLFSRLIIGIIHRKQKGLKPELQTWRAHSRSIKKVHHTLFVFIILGAIAYNLFIYLIN